jgi:hypothetical protein
MRYCYDFRRLNSAMQVAGHHSINLFDSQPLSHLLRLLSTVFVQTALRLSLHDLACVVDRLAMPY